MGFLVLTPGCAKTSASNENVPRTFLGTSIIIRIGLYAIYPMINKDIYIGPLIRQKVKERRLSINHFAAQIGCSRRRVYNIFEQKSILKVQEKAKWRKWIVSQSVLDFKPFGGELRKDGFMPPPDRAALPKHYHLLCKWGVGKAVTNSAISDLNFGDYLLQRYFDERKQANKLRTASLPLNDNVLRSNK